MNKFFNALAVVGRGIAKVFAFILPILPYAFALVVAFFALTHPGVLAGEKVAVEAAVVVIVFALGTAAAGVALTHAIKNPGRFFATPKPKPLPKKRSFLNGHAPVAGDTVA